MPNQKLINQFCEKYEIEELYLDKVYSRPSYGCDDCDHDCGEKSVGNIISFPNVTGFNGYKGYGLMAFELEVAKELAHILDLDEVDFYYFNNAPLRISEGVVTLYDERVAS